MRYIPIGAINADNLGNYFGLPAAEAWECGLDRRRGHSTVMSTKYRVRKHLLPFLASKAVQELRACDLQGLLDKLAKGNNYCLDTVKKVRQNAIEILNPAMGSKIIISNPFATIELQKGAFRWTFHRCVLGDRGLDHGHMEESPKGNSRHVDAALRPSQSGSHCADLERCKPE